jgi:protochlorophyllide reductase
MIGGMPWTLADMPSQAGRTVLVTGANDGLGFHVTGAFAAKGARVVMACRNQAKAESARHQLAEAHPRAALDLVAIDLGDLQSVKACADAVLARYATVDVIVCNAGLMAVPFGLTRDGLEMQMGVNYYGHYAFAGRLMPLIRRTPGARVVTVSSTAQWFGRLDRLDAAPQANRYNRWMAYSDSKLAILMLALILDEHFKRERIDAKGIAAHPGFARTNLRKTRLETETHWFQRLQLHVYEAMSMAGERGALPLLYAATAPDIRGGEYVGVSGPGEVRGWPKITRAQRRAYDRDLRERLLARSEAVTGVRFDA